MLVCRLIPNGHIGLQTEGRCHLSPIFFTKVRQDAAVDNQEIVYIHNFAKSKGDILLCRFNQNDAMQWWFDGAMVHTGG